MLTSKVSFYLIAAILNGCLPSTYESTAQQTSDLKSVQDDPRTGSQHRLSHTCQAAPIAEFHGPVPMNAMQEALLLHKDLPQFELIQRAERDGTSLALYYGGSNSSVVSAFPVQATFEEGTGDFRAETTEPRNTVFGPVLAISIRAQINKEERGAQATVTQQIASSKGTTNTVSDSAVLILDNANSWFAWHRILYSCMREVLDEVKP